MVGMTIVENIEFNGWKTLCANSNTFWEFTLGEQVWIFFGHWLVSFDFVAVAFVDDYNSHHQDDYA